MQIPLKVMWKVVGAGAIILGLFLQFDHLERVFLGEYNQVLGGVLAVTGIALLLKGLNPKVLGGIGLILVALLLVPVGGFMGWPIAESQPGLTGALPFWIAAAAIFVIGVRLIGRRKKTAVSTSTWLCPGCGWSSTNPAVCSECGSTRIAE